ncbi:kinase-like protein, partial [Auricularia subglabra TFB-10046 SS5]
IVQVAEGLKYLHVEQHVVHGSISPKSVLITGTGEAVLRDFSFSTSSVRDIETPTATWIRRCFRLPYAAPEILLDEAVDSDGQLRSKTFASDVYAFGMLLYEVITGRAPWADRTTMQMAVEVTNARFPPRPEAGELSDSLWTICEACWAREPSSRPGIASLLFCLQSACITMYIRISPTSRG